MSKKTNKMTTIELLDSFVPIICVCWVLVFAYIAIFCESSTLAMITVMPMFFLYGLYLVGSTVYCYKELEILEAMGKDTYEVEKKYRNQEPQLSIPKIAVAGGCFVVGILLCIFL
ncbi:MAG: hypothetical protein IJ043_07035 [Clostridia bacterium]|nr:hypothetical protein [Clostridia bacterium]